MKILLSGFLAKTLMINIGLKNFNLTINIHVENIFYSGRIYLTETAVSLKITYLRKNKMRFFSKFIDWQ